MASASISAASRNDAGAGAPGYTLPMLRAATSALRKALVEWGIDSPGVCEIVAEVALKAAFAASEAGADGLVEFVAMELLRFSRDEDEEEVAKRIIQEVLRWRPRLS